METPKRIIVVDDEKKICQNVEKILKKGNYQIEHATSADEALAKMAKESFSLLISDIIMPEKNGLELLKIVKEQWPLTKAIMMTAYASTDTAVKAIRMGALDYIPKPFTPDELRDTVAYALSGELIEADIPEKERKAIDIDVPFDRNEVASVTGGAYADTLGPSDMPVVEVKARAPLENFCETGVMVCDIFEKLGITCKAGTKTGECPRKKAAKKKASAAKKGFDSEKLIGIDLPFNYNEVISVTGPEYIRNLDSNGTSVPYYTELKENVARMMNRGTIDADVPFDREEVAKYTGDQYADTLGPSDMPVVEVLAREPLENFCDLGNMVCDIFKKLGVTCKAGTKTDECPKKKAKKKAAQVQEATFDGTRRIGPELPFDYDEVAAATGGQYVENMVYEGVVQIPYEQLKKNVARMLAEQSEKEADVVEFPAEPVTRNILVIDDEVAVNNNVRKILVRKGYHVDQAVTKAEALERIETHTYKLVLLDLKIPGVKGLELLMAVRDKNPETKVIMITGYASIETAVEAARMGAVDYLPKPFTPTEIRNATEKALQLAA